MSNSSNPSSSAPYDLATLASFLDAELIGDATIQINALATLKAAASGDLSFYHNTRYYNELVETRASAVILHKDQSVNYSGNKLLTDDPYVCYAKASQLFNQLSDSIQEIDPSASIHASAKLGRDVSVGANVVIGEGVVIADGVSIAPNTVIEAKVQIGEASRIEANVTLSHDIKIGKRAHIYAGTVIGSDGFGFARDGERYVKIAQLGSVILGDDVEVGANSSIDRGALDDTVIGNGVKIDNQVQIAHNVQIGDHTVICGCSAIAGSAIIGKNCVIAGAVGIINHVEIADGVTVTAMSLVNQSIRQAGSYSSGTGLSPTAEWKKNIVRFRQLDGLAKLLKKTKK